MKVTPQMAVAGEVVFSRMCGELISDYLFGCEVATEIYAAMEVERLADFRVNQQVGIAKARAEGRLRGRQTVVDVERLKALAADLGTKGAAQEMGISRVTAWRLLGSQKRSATAP